MHFADARLGWAVGEGGTILATHDGGASWARQRSGTEYLRGVHFADTRLGWAVGEGGTILATHDGGASWARQRSGTDKFLWGVHFADARLGWAVGGSGTIVATRDGGASWAPQRIGRSVDATSCSPIITNTEGNITITSNCLVTPEEIAQIMQARGGLSNRSFSGIGAWFNAQPEWLNSLLVLAGLSLLWCGFLFALWGIAPQKLVALHEWLPDPKALDQAAEVTGRGMKRCRSEGAERLALFVAAAVLANNLMIIGELLAKRPRRRRKTHRDSSADQRRGETNRRPYRDAQYNCTSQRPARAENSAKSPHIRLHGSSVIPMKSA